MTHRIFYAILFLSILLASGPAWAADCGASLAEARAIARDIAVEIDAPVTLPAGVPLKMSWVKRTAKKPGVPLYIVLTAPPEVRYAGSGFIALAAGAAGPYQMQFGKTQSRALFAAHRKVDTADRGELAVTAYRTGPQTFGWAVVTAGGCGEQVFAQDVRKIEITPGRPELVVQDRFATGKPNQIIRSNDGKYDLLVFDGRFEVHDAATDAAVFNAAGKDPNFSPTARFVAWRMKPDDSFSIADLVSGGIIARNMENVVLGWAKSDSYIVAGGNAFGQLTIKNSLVDQNTLYHGFYAGHPLQGWEVGISLDFDRGFVSAGGEIADLFLSVEPDDNGNDAAASGNTSADKNKLSEEDYEDGIHKKTHPQGWNLGERLKLSHTALSSNNSFDQQRRQQSAFLVRHSSRPAKAATNSAAATKLVGRAIAVGKFTKAKAFNAGTQSNAAFDSLASFGVNTLAPAPLQLIFDASNEPDQLDPSKRSKSTTDREKSVIRDIVSRVPKSDAIFRNKARDQRELDHVSDADDFLSRCNENFIAPDSIYKVWRWHAPSGDRWIVMSQWFEGSGAFAYGCLVLLREHAADPIVLLVSQLDFSEQGKAPAAGDGFAPLNGAGEGAELRIELSRLTESLVAVSFENGGGNNGIALIDAETAKRTAPRLPLIDGLILLQLRLTADFRNIAQLNKDGRFFIHRLADGKRLLEGAYVDDETVVMTDDGKFDTTYEGSNSVQVRFRGIPGLFAINQFAALLRRPNLAKDVLAGRDIAARPAGLQAPPTAQLIVSATAEAGRRSGKIVADSERGLSAICVYVDGRLSGDIPVQGTHAETPIDLPDPGGARWISAIAVDNQNLVSLPSAVQLPGAPRPRGVARVIAVGVDTYADPDIPPLQSTKVDARHFAQAIAGTKGHAFSSVSVTTLLDADVTPDSVLNAVRDAVSKSGSDDTLFFFFAGHGVDGAELKEPNAGLVLATNRTRTSNLSATSVRWQAVSELLSASKGTVVVVLDACHSGIAGRDAFSTNDDIVSALFTKSGAPLIVLAASKGRQLSQEAANAGGGRFTNAILAAMTHNRSKYDRDRSGLIDLDELYSGVKAEVEAVTDGEQTPWLARNRLVGEISLF